MFTATRIAAVITLIALGSGLALSGIVVGPGDEAAGPPGAEAPLVGDEWAFFSGTRADGGRLAAMGETFVEDGMEVVLGRSFSDQRLEADDSRITGTFVETFNTFHIAGKEPDAADGTGGAIWSNITVIENDGGTWTCEMTTVERAEILSDSGWCTGASDYEGLRAYMVIVGFTEVAGYITSDDGPPIPEVSAE